MPLSFAQEDARATALEYVKRAQKRDGSTIIILCGPSGVGKSHLLEILRNDLGDKEGIQLLNEPYPNEFQQDAKIWLCTATPDEVEVHLGTNGPLRELRDRGTDIALISVFGLTSSEVYDLLNNQATAQLTEPELVRLSLGVPRLALRMVEFNLNHEQAAALAGEYLRESGWALGSEAEKPLSERRFHYLHISPPEEVKAYLRLNQWSNFTARNIYHGLDHFFAQLSESKGRASAVLPYFKAQESFELYSQTVRSGGLDPVWPFPAIQIFVPGLSSERTVELLDELNEQRQWWRPRLFAADVSKTAVYFRTSQSEKTRCLHNKECEGYADDWEELLKAFQADQLPIQQLEGELGGFVCLLARDHPGKVGNQAMMGWALESYLQQKGIAYWAENGIIGVAYVYNTETQSLILSDPIVAPTVYPD